jgi:hypothetical protein
MNKKLLLYISFVLFLISGLTKVYAQENKAFGKKTYQVRTWGKGSRNVISKTKSSESRKGAVEIDMSIGFSLGFTNSLTEIGGLRAERSPLFFDVQLSHTHISYGGFFRMMFSETFGLNTTFCYAKLSGADTLSPRTSGRYWRKKSFDNTIIELGTRAEYFIPHHSNISGLIRNSELIYYGYLGIAGFYHDPDLRGTPDKYDMQMIQKNGIKPYSNFQVAIPMGIGILCNISEDIYVGFDIGWRKTFTDYLDGFTRPWSKGNDSYFITNFNISYQLPTWRNNRERSPRF